MPEGDTGTAPLLSPSEFMRARRPYLYSDSLEIEEATLQKEVFEYHLDSLTSRSQEADFERFCRRLAEKEICPNLKPQTGPVGGGDSKVDAETYPVADEITLTWYEGVGTSASQERWAFAFSAKKQWRAKVESDVAKAVNTGRGYKRVYFITSQFVRDKTRGDVEDLLMRKHSTEVHILDRTWIVERVFEHDRVALACETLRISGHNLVSCKTKGPRDTQRENDLRELENRIADPEMYAGVKYQLAEDCLEAALIARGLQLPRVEVDGRFDRARRVAKEGKNKGQLLRTIYAHAWTAFGWYEDFNLFNSLYDKVEALTVGSLQAADVELLDNLWSLLPIAAQLGDLDPKAVRAQERTACLAAELDRLAADAGRPNTALHARSLRNLMDLKISLARGESPDPFLAQIGVVLAQAVGLPEFPVEPILQIVSELGPIFVENPAYDELFEKATRVRAERLSDGDAGEAMLQRGLQFLNAGKHYEAIKMFGRAEQALAKEEYARRWVAALMGCGMAYESAGLLWAARANIVVAANQAFSWLTKYGELSSLAHHAMRRLVWLELKLGRIPCALTWFELADTLRCNLTVDEDGKAYFAEERKNQDCVLGMLLLRCDFHELKWLDFLPPILDEMELHCSWMALLYALGYEDYMRSEDAIPDSEDSAAVRDFFSRLLEQPASSDIPVSSETLGSRSLVLRSVVLGCEIRVLCPNEHTSIFLGETILAALESLLATFVGPDLVAFRPELEIHLQTSDLLVDIPESQISDEAGVRRIVVQHPENIAGGTRDAQNAFQEWLFKFVIQTTFQFAIPVSPKDLTERMTRDELSIGRASILSGYSTAIQNILGIEPKIRLSDWSAGARDQRFPLKRELAWNHDKLNANEVKDVAKSWKAGRGKVPGELPRIDVLRHKDIQVLSLIDIPLWNEAEWSGTGYVTIPGIIPMIALAFRNEDAAKKIFESWHVQIGRRDEKERLRIAIITGIDRSHPFAYRVHISSNLPEVPTSSPTHFIIASRTNRMDPRDGENLKRFLSEYKKTERYVLLPARLTPEGTLERLIWQYGIEKKELLLRPAWQIDENDADISALNPEDDPIIPEGVEDIPVHRAMKRLQDRQR